MKKELEFKDDFKIYWKENPVAKIKKGSNYLSPEIDIIADEALDINFRKDLINSLNLWIKNLISEELKDLINLIKFENNNKYLRALSFQLYENNGVLKRDNIKDIVESISKEDRKQLRQLGIKIGRYHIFFQGC